MAKTCSCTIWISGFRRYAQGRRFILFHGFGCTTIILEQFERAKDAGITRFDPLQIKLKPIEMRKSWISTICSGLLRVNCQVKAEITGYFLCAWFSIEENSPAVEKFLPTLQMTCFWLYFILFLNLECQTSLKGRLRYKLSATLHHFLFLFNLYGSCVGLQMCLCIFWKECGTCNG